MKTYWEVVIYPYVFLTSAIDVSVQLHYLAALTPRKELSVPIG
jgi:hypothetical protein